MAILLGTRGQIKVVKTEGDQILQGPLCIGQLYSEGEERDWGVGEEIRVPEL